MTRTRFLVRTTGDGYSPRVGDVTCVERSVHRSGKTVVNMIEVCHHNPEALRRALHSWAQILADSAFRKFVDQLRNEAASQRTPNG